MVLAYEQGRPGFKVPASRTTGVALVLARA